MTLVAEVLAFASAALCCAGLLGLGPARLRAARAPGGRGGADGARLLRALAFLGGRLRPALGARAPLDLEARIAAAGRPGGLGTREVMLAKAAGALGGACAGVLLAAVTPGRLGIFTVLAGPVAGFLAPDLWLSRRATERSRSLRRALPATLDLLRVGVEAGMSLVAALEEVGSRSSGPLAAECRAVAREVALGVPLSAALGGLWRRAPLPEVLSLTAALERTARHGVPLAETLGAQAHDARLARRRRIAEEAARAGPKIQLVVALLLVPSVMLLVAAALVAALVDGGGVMLA